MISKLTFSDFPHDDVVRAVKQGRVDAGTVRTGVLEHMATNGNINLSEFKIINPKLTPDFPFAHSTPLYPEWTIATTKHTPSEIAKKVVIALLNLDGNSHIARSANSAGWTVPLDYLPVHELMKELKVGPYKDSVTLTLNSIIKEHTLLILLVMVILLAISAIFVLKGKKLITEYKHDNNNFKRTILSLENQVSSKHVHSRRIISVLEASTNDSLSLAEKLNNILKKGCHYFGMELGIISEINAITKTFIVLSSYGIENFSARTDKVFDLNNSFTGVTANYDEPLIIEDISNSELKNHHGVTGEEIKSFLGIKLLKNGKSIGTLEFYSFSMTNVNIQNCIELLRVMGNLVGNTIESTRQEQSDFPQHIG